MKRIVVIKRIKVIPPIETNLIRILIMQFLLIKINAPNVEVQEIIAGNQQVKAIKYKNRESENESSLNISGVFVQIGLIPNSQFLKGVVELNNFGEIIVNEYGETSEEGIFACGDVTTVPYKQIIISMGEGAKASLAASDYLMKQPAIS